jgi:lipopolysaccharide transport system permease protein
MPRLKTLASQQTNNFMLFKVFAKREVYQRYKGSWLGLFWAVINPLLLLAIYSFVFGLIFKARWPTVNGQEANFSVLLFCGLITHMLLAEVVTGAPSLIVGQANYVKKVVFPLRLFGVVQVSAAVFHYLISFLILLFFAAFSGVTVTFSLLYFPVLLGQFCVLLVGVSWLLSSLGVYVRDITYIAGFLSTALMFLSPIFYPADAVPEAFGFVMNINPLTYYVNSFRGLAIYGVLPPLDETLQALAVAIGFFVLGGWVFNRLKKGFADVL